MIAPITSRRCCRAVRTRWPIHIAVQASLFMLLAAAPVNCLTFSQAYAASFPHKPITIVVYTKQGGPIDLTARRLVKIAAKYTDATFVVEYKTGAGGVLAMEHVLQSRADGYTLLACTKSNVAKMVSTGRERYASQLAWIALLMTDPECVITHRDSEISRWDPLVRDGQTRTDEQIWGGPSRGGLDHVTAMQIWDRFGMRARWIPYEGGDQALQALLTKQLVAYVGNPGDATGQPDLQVSIVSSPQRLAHLPDTPTFAEYGFAELDQLYMWRGFALRKGCPTEAKRWYSTLFQNVTSDPEWQSTWDRDGIQVKFVGEDDFHAIVEANRQEFRRYLKRLDLLPEAQASSAAGWFAQPSLRVLAGILAAHLGLATILARWHHWDRFGDLVILCGLLSVSLVLFWETSHFPALEGSRAAAVPRLWMALVGALGVGAAVTRRTMRPAARPSSETRIDLVAKLSVVLILHVLLTLYAGYSISTALMLIATMMLLGERRWPVLLGVTCVWLVFAYFTFSRLLFVPLPTGSWFDAMA
jgi:putative tricarboxylic transport membrane protein